MKDRPCAVILSAQSEAGDLIVAVLPITHSPPHDPELAMAIPDETKNRLGLDQSPSWIVLSEANKFIWPGPDVRPKPGEGPESVAMGFLPGYFIEVLRQRYLALHEQRKTVYVARSSEDSAVLRLSQVVIPRS